MSKAFTKETDADIDDDAADDAVPAIPAGAKNYITPEGLARLQAELKELKTVERPKVVEIVSWAAGNGDRSENGDYLYGKKRLREIDRRIRFLLKRLEIAEVVDPALQKLLLWGTGQEHITFSWKHGGGEHKYGGKWEGIIPELLSKYRNSKSGMQRRQLEKYMSVMGCQQCEGRRLNE